MGKDGTGMNLMTVARDLKTRLTLSLSILMLHTAFLELPLYSKSSTLYNRISMHLGKKHYPGST